MLKKMVNFACLALLVFTASTVFAEQKMVPYIGGFAGISFTEDNKVRDNTGINNNAEFDPGGTVGGFGGVDFGMARVEGELSLRGADISRFKTASTNSKIDGDISLVSFMANGYYDIHNRSPITPYVGGGVGFSRFAVSTARDVNQTYYIKDQDLVFTYQLATGVSFDLNRRITMDIGYRYVGTNEADFENSTVKYDSHNFIVGARYYFR